MYRRCREHYFLESHPIIGSTEGEVSPFSDIEFLTEKRFHLVEFLQKKDYLRVQKWREGSGEED